MSKRHAVVNEQGHIVNVIVWDGVSPWSPPAGHSAIRHDHCAIGDRWDHESKELIKVCRIRGCEHESHADQQGGNKTSYTVHESHRVACHEGE